MDKDKNALHTYLDEIGQQRLLTDEEERQLADRIQAGDQRATDRLVSANLTFVVAMARQYQDRGLPAEDLISEGNIGMLRAAARFDGRQGKRFVAFAAPYIRQAMEQAVEQQGGLYRVPRNVADTRLEKKRSHPLSIDAPVGGSQELSLGRIIADADAPDPDRQLEQGTLLAELQQLVARLEPRERQVVERFYGLGTPHLTMAEIGREMGLKRERVRQIRDKAVRRVCRLTRSTELRDYLKQ